MQQGDLFEGRHEEVESLLAAVATAAAERTGGVVLVRGEAGIGKSSLLDRAVEDWTECGWHVLHLRPDELDRQVPYAALTHAVVAAHWFGSTHAGHLATGLVDALSLTERHSVTAVHAAAHRLLSVLRDRSPALVAIDDLALVDEDTMVLVANLMRRSERHPLVLVGALRHPGVQPSGALASLIERAQGDGVLQLVDVGPLSGDALTTLANRMLGGQVHPKLISFVERRSAGNPFLAIQTLLDLHESRAIGTDDSGCRLAVDDPPLSVDRRTAVLSRVVRIEPDARQLAGALALLGSTSVSQLGVAADLAGLSDSQSERAFDLLVERGIITDDGESYRFAHQLVRDALYEELGPAERWRWHKRAASRLRELPRSPRVEHEIARHVRETAEAGDEDAISVLFQVAERVCTSAPHSSIPWYRHALAITPPEHPRRAEVTARLARAFFLAGRTREAADTGREALGALPAGRGRSRLVMLVIEALIKSSAVDEATEMIDLERARTWTPILAARAAHILAVAGRSDAALDAADEATAELEEMTAYDRLAALVDLVQMTCSVGFRRLPWLAEELRSVATDAPLSLRLNAYTTLGYAYAMCGDTQAGTDATQRAQRLLAESGWSLYQADLAVARVQNLFMVGDWDSALSVVDEVMGELDASDSHYALNLLRSLQATLYAHRGEWPAARRALKHDPPSTHAVYAAVQGRARAELSLLSGDPDGARAELTRHLGHQGVGPYLRALLYAELAEIELEAGAVDAAVAWLAEARSFPVDELDYSTRVRIALSSARAKRDIDGLRETIEHADEHRFALLRGRARLYLGAMDVEPERHLHDAIRIFHTLGAAPWRRHAAAELRRRDLPVPRHRPATSTFLTETEAQIARLIQLGRPNREIAVALSLSVKTVEGYLSRIYEKTGCASRLELARALDDGLLG